MGTPANQLEYAPQSTWHRRHGIRRAIVVAAVLLVALGSIKWLGPAWGHAKLLYWQRLCMRYERPASQAIDLYEAVDTKEWTEFYALLSPPGRKRAPIAFLGELRRKDGVARLVVIEVATARWSFQGAEAVSLDYHIIAPAGLSTRPRLVRNGAWYLPSAMYPPVVLSDTQRDLQDQCHIVMRFDSGGSGDVQVIDAWLQKDDSLVLEARRNESSASARR